MRCVDLGCNVGGFTDCLLTRGAEHVTAVDTGYGVLDYTLRIDERVTVRERTNALHVDAPETPVDLAVIDLAWTRQRHAIPAACRWLSVGGLIISLVKPHYEVEPDEKAWLVDGRLEPENAERVTSRVLEAFARFGAEPLAATRSPVIGGKSGRKAKGKGNVEYLVWARSTGARVTEHIGNDRS